MITFAAAKNLKKARESLGEQEALFDKRIRIAIITGDQTASIEVALEETALALQTMYQAQGWKSARVQWTGSDRAYSPRDGWTLTVDLADV